MYTDIDLRNFVVDALNLIKEAYQYIKQILQHHKLMSKEFKDKLAELTMPKDRMDTKAWVSRVKNKLLAWDKQVTISRNLRSPMSLFKALCNVFTLKLDKNM